MNPKESLPVKLRHLIARLFRRPNRTAQVPALVKTDREAFARRALQLYFTDQNSSEAQEVFRILEEPLRTRADLHRVV